MVNGKDKETDVDSVVKSQVMRSFVIPAKAGIQPACACPHADRYFQVVTTPLDSGFHRSDDFLRDHLMFNIRLFNIRYFIRRWTLNVRCSTFIF